MLCLRDVNLRNDSDSSALGILHNLPSIFLSVVPATLEVGCELREATRRRGSVDHSGFLKKYHQQLQDSKNA